MNKKTFTISLLLTFTILVKTSIYAQITVTGSNGADNNYTSLINDDGAFVSINAKSQTGKDIAITITGSTSEIGRNSLNGMNWNTLKIYPTKSNLTISGNPDVPLIHLNGAKNVLIDGSIGGNGSTPSLTLKNTSQNSCRVIQFSNSAQNNTVKNCNIQGESGQTESGTIFFSETESGKGNDKNTITLCNITGRCTNAVYSIGTQIPNSNNRNTISNNNFYNLWRTDRECHSIHLAVNTTNFIITGNSFFETTAIKTSNPNIYSFIYLNGGSNHTVSNNYMGGQSKECGGYAFDLSINNFNNPANKFNPIYINVGTAVASTVQGNIIQNFNYAFPATFSAIYVNAGVVNILNNTIGKTTGNNSIILTGVNTSVTSYGIYINTPDKVTLTANTIGSITAGSINDRNRNKQNAHNFYGIYKANKTGDLILSGNLIGSTDTGNSIQSASESINEPQLLCGIYSAGTGNITLSDNTVANLTNNTTREEANNNVYGFYIDGAAATTINRNFIHSLHLACSNKTATNEMAGIYIGDCDATCFNNIILLGQNSSYYYGIYGIKDANTTDNTKKYYHNTIYISGACQVNNGNGKISNTAAFYKTTDIGSTNIQNNIFFNARTGGFKKSGSHYAIYLAGTSKLTINFNDYFINGTNGILGFIDNDDLTDLGMLQSITKQDNYSFNADPKFISDSSTLATDYKIKHQMKGSTALLATIPDDFGLNTRTQPTIGAWELSNFWLGRTNIYWKTQTNWTAGFSPSIGEDVIFATIANNKGIAAKKDLYLDNDYIINNLINNTDKRLVIPTSKSLTVMGTITTDNNPDRIVIKANNDPLTKSPNGSLIFNQPLLNLSVQATVEMYSKAKILSPLTTPKTGFQWQYFGIPVRKLISASPTLDGSYVREYKYNKAGQHQKWNQLVNSSSLYPFKGYEITQNAPTAFVFKGTLVNNDTTILLPIAASSEVFEPEQHILSNPYTAAIDIRTLTFKNADKVVYLYSTGSFEEWSVNGGYTTSGESNGQYLAIPKSTAGGSSGLPYDIPSMSGFLVKATGVGASIDINYSSVSVTKNVNPQRIKAEEEVIADDFVSTMIDLKGQYSSDRMWIFTETTCTKNYDNGWDGPKILGSALSPQIFAVEPDGIYQVNSVNDINNTSIAFQPGNDTEFTLTFTHTNTRNSYSGLYLVDLVEKRTIDITESGTEYIFNSDPTPGALNRFKIFTRPYEEEPATATQLKIFGSQGMVLVDNQGTETGNALLYDTTGRLLQKISLNAGGITAFPNNLNPGVYLVKALTKSGERTERLLISGDSK